MSEWSDLPVLQECRDSYPNRPEIDVATTPWTREVLSRKIDYYMGLLESAVRDADSRETQNLHAL